MSTHVAARPQVAASPQPASSPPIRIGFVLEYVLGHASWAESLRSAMASVGNVEARWARTDLYRDGGLVERCSVLPSVLRASLRARLDMRAGLRGFRPDVLFFNTQKPAYLCQAEMLRTPTMLMTDVTPRQYDRMADLYGHAPDGDSLLARAKHRTNVLNFRLARAVVAWSNWTARSLIDEYGVPPVRVHVVPPGVDTRWWRPAEQRTPHDRPRLLFVGGNFERKGGALLLDLFRREELYREAELHIVTRDAIAPEQGVVIHRGLTNNSPELLALYQQADAFILPTQADCFSIASIEAMATGLPVVTSALGGIGDIAEDGVTGFLIAPEDGRTLTIAIRRLLDAPNLRAAFAVAGRARAEQRFDARLSAERIVSIARTLQHAPLPFRQGRHTRHRSTTANADGRSAVSRRI
jgi:glycosyltransferase involved in cell wall biosynthesis